MISLLEAFCINEENDVIEMPKQNASVSLFPQEKKIIFNQIEKDKTNNAIRSLINQLKQNFNIQKTISNGAYSFEVLVDPTEDFDSVVNFIKNEIDINQV